MKKMFAPLLLVLIIIASLCACTQQDLEDMAAGNSDANREISSEDHSANTLGFNDENYFDLNANDLFEVVEEISSDSIFVLEEVFYTNSHAISVTNNSDSCVEVYLFRKNDLDQAIQQFTLEGESSKSFSNLTSRFLYQIGIGVETDSQICLSISR